MRAIVLSIGAELLRGDIVDTNAAFLTRELSRLGANVDRVEQVGDDLDALRGSLSRSLSSAEIIVCTGGLGPTEDDLTRQAIAAALDETLYCDESLVAEIEQRFHALRRNMPQRNRQQALLIPSSEPLHNPNGTAPGWLVRRDGYIIAAMPGPPSEMRPMWEDQVRPVLEELISERTAMRSLMTFGLGESTVEERISDCLRWRPEVTIATYAKEQGVEVHITARAPDAATAAGLAEEAERMVRERLGHAVFGAGQDTLAQVVGRMLAARSLTVAVMESATGGLLSSMLTDIPGSSEYFRGGIVAYAPDAKAEYGVSRQLMETYGLISEQVAESMARAARSQFQTHIGLGVTGIAGSDPVEGKAPGTCFVAISTGDTTLSREIHRPGSREVVKAFAARCALDLLRRHLEHSSGDR